MKNQKGITLVALVVTIVVLLILAGVTIALVMQGDSIFGKAEDAKTKTNKDAVESAVSLALLELQTNYYDPSTKDTIKTALGEKLIEYMPDGMTLALTSGKEPTYIEATGAVNFSFEGTVTVTATSETYSVKYTAADAKLEVNKQ